MADLVDQADLEAVVTPSLLAQLLSDDGTETVSSTLLVNCTSVASDLARGHLRPGYPDNAQIDALVLADAGVRFHVAMLAIGIAAMRRPGLLAPDGQSPLSSWKERAEKALRDTGKADRRAAGEQTAGTNANLTSSVAPEPAAVFRPTKLRPLGPGGF